MSPLTKTISLPQSVKSGSDGNYRINSYRFRSDRDRSNREVLSSTGTSTVRLWALWDVIQPNPVNSYTASCDALNGGLLTELDLEIAKANADNRAVILSIDCRYPLWANNAAGLPGDVAGREQVQRYPTDVTTNSPFGWFVAHLLLRYRASNPRPAPAGTTSNFSSTGNPQGAYISFLEVANEPNLLMWPQSSGGTTASLVTAVMTQTAEAYCNAYGGPALLGPGISDFPTTSTSQGGQVTATGAVQFASEYANWMRYLKYQGNATPRVYLGLTEHNYQDVRYGRSDPQTGGTLADSRARSMLGAANTYGWHDPTRCYLTEGGWVLANPSEANLQAQRVALNFNEMKAQLPEAKLWTQHCINNSAYDSRKYGMRADATGEIPPGSTGPLPPPPVPGADRPLLATWASLTP